MVVLSNRRLENSCSDLTRSCKHGLPSAHPCIVSVATCSTFAFDIRRVVVKMAECPWMSWGDFSFSSLSQPRLCDLGSAVLPRGGWKKEKRKKPTALLMVRET